VTEDGWRSGWERGHRPGRCSQGAIPDISSRSSGGVQLARDRSHTLVGMTPEEIADLVHLRRARDLMDRDHAQPLDVPAMARAALMSPAHFSRKFRAAYGETPYAYLMTRRIERAKALLRQGMSVTDTCVAVGCTSLGSFSSRFSEIVGQTPSQYRARDHRDHEVVPPCVSKVATRPRRSRVTV
jgi:transcriptional regulator GlxA family with amidase domain